ncbi:hypothetical protein N8973_00605, partial [bacterium]|nr:hypothetical protein [bacterium]
MKIITVNKFAYPYSGGIESVSKKFICDIFALHSNAILLNVCSNPEGIPPKKLHINETVFQLKPFMQFLNMPLGFFVLQLLFQALLRRKINLICNCDYIVFHSPNPQYLI